jgi:diguanylate cyclase (GGDEF)-like protein
MNQRRLLAFAFVALTWCGIAAAEAPRDERGFPLITMYIPSQHNAGTQSFDVTQDARGVMYFGNLHGLLSFDGAWWRVVPLPNDSAALRVQSNDRGEVAVGASGELGLAVVTEDGAPAYRSLVQQLPAEARNFGDVLSICAAGDRGFLFLTDRFAFLWNGSEMRVVADARLAPLPRRCYRIGDSIWLIGANGVEKFDETSMRITPVALAGTQADIAIDGGDGRVIVVTHDAGLYALAAAGIVPFAPEAAKWLRGKTITSGCRLHDGRIVIATRQDGVLVVDANGDPDQLLDHAAGLPDDVVASAFTDREGSLWLAMHGAIARVDIASPVTLLDERSGIKGSVSAFIRYDGRLYAGTSHGLFVLDPRATHGISAANIAHAVPGVPGAVWRLALGPDGELLIATSDGAFQLRGNGDATRIAGTAGLTVYGVNVARDGKTVRLLTRQFVGILTRDNNGWKFAGPLAGSSPHTRTMVERDGVLWCGTTFNGIVRIDMRVDPPRIDHFGRGEMGVFDVGGELAFGTRKALVRIGSNGQLEPDPMFAGIRVAPDSIFFDVALDARDRLWINTRPPRQFERDAKGRFGGDGVPLVSIDAPDVRAIAADPDGVVWFGTANGLNRYEPGAPIATPRPGIRASGGNRREYGFGRMRVEFIPASYRPGLMYQYRLESSDNAWSAWTSEPFIDYTNLAPGDYTFHLRTRGAGPAVSDEALWSFHVVPPWDRTAWAIVQWLLIGAALIYLIVRLRTAALNRQAARLREKIAERTDELRQTVDQLRVTQQQLVEKNELLVDSNGRLERLSLLDELTGIANRRYFQRAIVDDWARAIERQQPLALILIDLDHFKDLNDTHGHQAGDACLRQIGIFLAQQSRRSGDIASRAGDLVARYGGEEFALLLTDTSDDEARKLADRLRAGIEAMAIPYNDDVTLRVTASCGVASMVPASDDTFATLIARADRALYAAKYEGRNRVSLSSDATVILSV